MQAFEVHKQIVSDYKEYLKSFNIIRDERIRQVVDDAFRKDEYLPEPLIQFNPAYRDAAGIDQLINENILHQDIRKTFGSYTLFEHQEKAIRLGADGKSFIVTSGTGSGKSLTFLGTVFNYIFKEKPPKGVKAILVYPMNALINSQEEEIRKFADNYGDEFPVTFRKYTGQESQELRREIEADPPDILLTNYMMLELILTRAGEKYLRDSFSANLRYLVFDELHTYRGRQGADVAMLIRRLKALCSQRIQCIGTSATMISGGKPQNTREVVADYATRIFGEAFAEDQIIEESLKIITNYNGTIPSAFDLQEIIHRSLPTDGSEEAFRDNPLAIWVENRIALVHNEDGNIRRARPVTLKELVEALSADANEPDTERCFKALMELFEWSEALNIKNIKNRITFLPFKVHQFISQAGNVYVTLESRKDRRVTLEDGMYIKEATGKEKTIYPLMFSRYSGFDFICVKRNFEEMRFEPRNPHELPERITKQELKGSRKEGKSKRLLTDNDFESGYLLLPENGEDIWEEDQVQNLPDAWWKLKNGRVEVDNYYEFRVPVKVWFNAEGNFSYDQVPGLNLTGWFIAAPLCMDPTSGVVFDPRTNENTKLMRIGSVGKSTATTITTFSILKSQHYQRQPKEVQKVLSFTDNRQDASLQAGHFNDFMMIGRLRSAIYHALKSSGDRQLKIDRIAHAVYEKLGLTEEDYARNVSEDSTWPDPENEKAIKDYLTIRILYDLRRGWRYNTPNLEQCALLRIDYEMLDEFCARDDFFRDDLLLSAATPDQRYNFLLHVLNYFRTSNAFDYYLLDEGNRKNLEDRLKQHLDQDKEWSLEADERLETPSFLIYRSPGKKDKRIFTNSIGPNSNLGKYIKRMFIRRELEAPKGEDLATYTESLCLLLKRGHFLADKDIKGDKSTEKGFRLRVEKVIWRLGDGKSVLTDEVRIVTTGRDLTIEPNSYFKRFYQQDFPAFDKFFHASEHTGQIGTEQRIEREKGFRRGDISALYCSPTMELGIDISTLNIVHMRNVPPNPANYTQRSGRAGRSGQTALVFTYCSYISPHDRHYFNNSRQMVAGEVKAPTIDLCNEELIANHFYAYILMQLGLRDVKRSINDVIDTGDRQNLPVRESIKNFIEGQASDFSMTWIKGFKEIIADQKEILESTSWYNDEWLISICRNFYPRLEKSFDRWRRLFRTASGMIEKGTVVMNDPTIASSSFEHREARRMVAIGSRQRDLLQNEISGGFNGSFNSEFYIYRYLAAEGFLPGYNFTRLPIRAFVGRKSQEQGTYISRARFIALREFGPSNLIYHDGGKFRITRMQLTEADMKTEELKISRKTGYAWLGEEGRGINNDPFTGEPLMGQTTADLYKNLLEMVEADTWPVERISSEEEDRMSSGYDIEQFFYYPKGMESTLRSTIKASGHPLLNLTFCQACRLIQVNKKWIRSKEEENGFVIGKTSGKWLRQVELENPEREKDPAVTVRLYTTDTADSLYLQPVEALELGDEGVISLTWALKRAICRVFQVEESEIEVWFMGPEGERNILIFESAQGSLGILSQMAEDTGRLKEVFREAYRVIHYDPEIKEDTAPNKPKASYDDLLSYYNQRYHDKLDRHSIKAALELLMICEADNTSSASSRFSDRDAHYNWLLNNLDSSSDLERRLINYLYNNRIRMPDDAQVNLSTSAGYYVSGDFIYMDGDKIGAIVFCDGSVHDETGVQEDDRHKRQLLRDAGYDVIEWHYTEAPESLVNRRKDIFRKL